MTFGLLPPLARIASNNESYLLLRGAGCSSRTSRCRFTAFALHFLSSAAGRPDGRRYDSPPAGYMCRSLFHMFCYRLTLLRCAPVLLKGLLGRCWFFCFSPAAKASRWAALCGACHRRDRRHQRWRRGNRPGRAARWAAGSQQRHLLFTCCLVRAQCRAGPSFCSHLAKKTFRYTAVTYCYDRERYGGVSSLLQVP